MRTLLQQNKFVSSFITSLIFLLPIQLNGQTTGTWQGSTVETRTTSALGIGTTSTNLDATLDVTHFQGHKGFVLTKHFVSEECNPSPCSVNDYFVVRDYFAGGFPSPYYATKLIMDKNGNVGIGTPLTNNPNNYKLAVNGVIGAKEVRVEINSSTWPDYVFQENYELMPLEELQDYINTNSHLPGIPSASTVEEEGIGLAEMNILLLKKLEENTLYLLQLNAELEELRQKLNSK